MVCRKDQSLGLLFIVFINDLPGQIENSVVDICADDMTLSYAQDYSNAPQSIAVELQKDITSLANWSRSNHLVMNEEKTKTMLSTGRRLKKKLDTFDIHLTMNGKKLEQVSSFELLGLTFGDELSFDVLVENLCLKLSQRIAVPSKIKRCLPHRERIIYYNAMIKPLILYESAVWTITSKENLNRVLKLQNRVTQVILDLDTSTRSVDMFKQLNWIPYYDEVKILKGTTAYKRINSESPGYLTNMLKLNSSVNSRVTRYSNLNFLGEKLKVVILLLLRL